MIEHNRNDETHKGKISICILCMIQDWEIMNKK
jgi:hypothetical protein